jgi:DNA-binding NarL/FixJ family response regulator
VHAFLGVPLRRRSLPMGMIGLANRAGGYAQEHEHLLVTYAAQVAIAIYNSQLYDQLKAAKDELERVMVGQFATLKRTQMQNDSGFSNDDIEVLSLVVAGASNAEISAALNWSLPSVKRKLHRISVRLGARSRAQAAAEAVRRGLI